MNKSVKNIIDTRLESVRISSELEEKILARNSFVPKKRIIKPLAAAVIVCLSLILAVPVLGATVPSFNELLSQINPEFALFLKPVQLVCEDSGIKMEVIAAMNDDESVIVYLSMQDLTGKRIDETLELLSFKVSDTFVFTHELVAYDEKTKTATIRLSANGMSNINGKKITVGINSFLSGKTVSGKFDTEINLSEFALEANTVGLNTATGSISYGYSSRSSDSFIKDNRFTVLKPNELNIPLPGIDFARISNIGFVDGKLHVQVNYTNKKAAAGINDSGSLYLMDEAGNVITPNASAYFGSPDESGNMRENIVYSGDNMYIVNEYTEYVFDISPESLSGYKLIGDYFTTFGGYTTGNWQTTFKIESVKRTKTAECDIDWNGIKINRVSVSPIGITVYGTGETTYNSSLNILVYMADGSVKQYGAGLIKTIDDGGDISTAFTTDHADESDLTQSYSSHVQGGLNGEVYIKFMPRLPLDIDSITAISINGVEVDLK